MHEHTVQALLNLPRTPEELTQWTLINSGREQSVYDQYNAETQDLKESHALHLTLIDWISYLHETFTGVVAFKDISQFRPLRNRYSSILVDVLVCGVHVVSMTSDYAEKTFNINLQDGIETRCKRTQ